jgi:hypothetical protein
MHFLGICLSADYPNITCLLICLGRGMGVSFQTRWHTRHGRGKRCKARRPGSFPGSPKGLIGLAEAVRPRRPPNSLLVSNSGGEHIFVFEKRLQCLCRSPEIEHNPMGINKQVILPQTPLPVLYRAPTRRTGSSIELLAFLARCVL